ncbi:MAG: hypothetical protein HYV09_40950 [Deltaproteobacteria bacterium]|nr:hypothetical protein [Deltaproteobacteria bacterium]
MAARLLVLASIALSCRQEDAAPIRADRVFDSSRVEEPIAPAPAPSSTRCSATGPTTPDIDKMCLKATISSADAVAQASCGATVTTKVTLTFAPAGTVAAVALDPPVAPAVASCLRATFEKCRVPPFAASSAWVRWRYPGKP